MIDGGVVNNTPISHAVDLGADRIFVLPAWTQPVATSGGRSALDTAMHGLGPLIEGRLQADIARYSRDVELVVLPAANRAGVQPTSFDHADRLIDGALIAARAQLARHSDGTCDVSRSDRPMPRLPTLTASPERAAAARLCSVALGRHIDRLVLVVAARQHRAILPDIHRPVDLPESQTASDPETSPELSASCGDSAQGVDRAAGDGRAPVALSLEQRLGARLGPTTSFVTTEHFNLQTARSITVSEANGRASIYLAAVSSNLIALAFIGQMSRLGAAFYAFALILLPVLAFVGLVTFLRLVQSSMEDVAYAHRIGLLRDFYLQVSPELEAHLLVIRGSRATALLDREGLAPSGWQLALTIAGMVAVVNSMVVAAVAGVALAAAGIHSLAVPVAFGAIVGACALTLHQRHHRRARDAYAPEGVDRAATFVPPSPQADTA